MWPLSIKNASILIFLVGAAIGCKQPPPLASSLSVEEGVPVKNANDSLGTYRLDYSFDNLGGGPGSSNSSSVVISPNVILTNKHVVTDVGNFVVKDFQGNPVSEPIIIGKNARIVQTPATAGQNGTNNIKFSDDFVAIVLDRPMNPARLNNGIARVNRNPSLTPNDKVRIVGAGMENSNGQPEFQEPEGWASFSDQQKQAARTDWQKNVLEKYQVSNINGRGDLRYRDTVFNGNLDQNNRLQAFGQPRSDDGKAPPVGMGDSGGGLFDSQGRLVGLSARGADGENGWGGAVTPSSEFWGLVDNESQYSATYFNPKSRTAYDQSNYSTLNDQDPSWRQNAIYGLKDNTGKVQTYGNYKYSGDDVGFFKRNDTGSYQWYENQEGGEPVAKDRIATWSSENKSWDYSGEYSYKPPATTEGAPTSDVAAETPGASLLQYFGGSSSQPPQGNLPSPTS